MNNIEKELVKVENNFFNIANLSYSTFKKLDANIWLQEKCWPLQVVKQIKNYPFIILYPLNKVYLKSFVKNILSGVFSKDIAAKAFLGALLKYPFSNSYQSKILADAVLINGSRKLLFYRNLEKPYIIKIFGDYKKFLIEKTAIEYALKVTNLNVKVPKILNTMESESFAIQQEWIVDAVTLRQIPNIKRQDILDKVMIFMREYYRISEVKIVTTDTLDLNNFFIIRDYLVNINEIELLLKFENLIALNKSVFYGLKHGDLNVDNILVSKTKDLIYIIDWGEGFEGLIINDLSKGEKNGRKVFDQLCVESHLEGVYIHSFNEQLYIDLYLKFINKVYKRYIKDGLLSGLTQPEIKLSNQLRTLEIKY